MTYSNDNYDYNYLPNSRQKESNNVTVNIYEFSRQLLDISHKNGKWFSGGFGLEVGKSNEPVPPEIENAVNKGDFRINDNYPPKEGEYALIAREMMDKFSVLAVATRVEDNKTRYLIAYRYFWLQKPDHQDIDGVGTLLSWWIAQGEQKFDFTWNPDYPNLNYNAPYNSRDNSYQDFEQYRTHIENILDGIQKYPFAFPINQAPSRHALHYLALYLNRKYETPISWAWNVGSLEHPEKFTLICSDEKCYQYNLNDIQKHQKQLVRIHHQQQSPARTTQYKTQPIPKVTDDVWYDIRKCLLEIANNNGSYGYDNTNLEKLAQYLELYPCSNWDWNRIIDNSIMNYPSHYGGAKYRALLAILGHITAVEWLKNVTDIKNNSFVDIQQKLWDVCDRYKKSQALKQLEDNMTYGILCFMEKYHEIANKNNPTTNERQLRKSIEQLLRSNNNLWSQHYRSLLERMNQLGGGITSSPTGATSGQRYPDNQPIATTSTPNPQRNTIFASFLDKITNTNGIVELFFAFFVISILVGVISFLGVIPFSNPFSQNPQQPKVDNLPQKTDNLQSAVDLYIGKSDTQAKKKIKEYLEKLKDIDSGMPDNQDNYNWLTKEFLPQDLTYPKNNPEYIKQTQKILKQIGYPVEKTDGKLDNNTKKQISNFQEENKVTIKQEEFKREDGTIRAEKDTWKALNNQLKNKQIVVASEFLLNKLEQGDNNNFYQHIKKLKECREKDIFVYIDCVNNLENSNNQKTNNPKK